MTGSIPRERLEAERDTSLWHKKLQALHAYWRSLCRGELLPRRHEIDPVAIPHLLDSLYLINIEREPLAFRYRLIGTKLVDYRGRELKGLTMEEAHAEFATSAARQHYVDLAESGALQWRKGPVQFNWGQGRATIERLLLPLASDGRIPDCIIGMSVFSDERGRET
ncbi:MAG: PAS domain-containing protein [Proteobacteria bacterium]|nr:PAS domain-containing protein [Pseudomonadota bacterium]MBI3499775.1 PAS domain-containing protein [Pseudomonadota bacterium]